MSGGGKPTVYGYWHNRAVDGKQICNHYAHDIGGECGKPDLGVWTPLVKQGESCWVYATDAVWMAKLAREWVARYQAADPVDRAARRVITYFGTRADRAALEAES